MKFIDLTGRSFGKLVVLSEHPERQHKQIRWNCLCECGVKKVIQGTSLKSGNAKSCGCGVTEATIERCTTHGMTGSTEFSIWKNMLSRCHNKENPGFPDYGARGIEVCAEWRHSFSTFYSDMGPRPSSDYTIDRRDNSAGYSRANCRWATRLEQAKNTRRSKIWIVDGVEFETSIAAAKALNVSSATISRWCSGHKDTAPRKNCSSFLRYQDQDHE